MSTTCDTQSMLNFTSITVSWW